MLLSGSCTHYQNQKTMSSNMKKSNKHTNKTRESTLLEKRQNKMKKCKQSKLEKLERWCHRGKHENEKMKKKSLICSLSVAVRFSQRQAPKPRTSSWGNHATDTVCIPSLPGPGLKKRWQIRTCLDGHPFSIKLRAKRTAIGHSNQFSQYQSAGGFQPHAGALRTQLASDHRLGRQNRYTRCLGRTMVACRRKKMMTFSVAALLHDG